jgi:hypothetical protein
VRSRRSPSTRGVVSVTMHRTPPTSPGLVAHRVVGDVEVGLLEVAEAHHEEREGRSPSRPRQSRARPRAAGRAGSPRSRSTLPARAGRARSVLRAEHGCVGVVVDRGEVAAPEQHDLRARRHRKLTALRRLCGPADSRPERRVRPVERADPFAHLAAAGQEGERRSRSGCRFGGGSSGGPAILNWPLRDRN